jgi:hypothetical protein
MRTRLMIEFSRLMDWREAAGLIDRDPESDLPGSLKSDRLVLVAILTEMQTLMEGFAKLNGKYEQLRVDKSDDAKNKAEETDLLADF